jgi:hypothetical protein
LLAFTEETVVLFHWWWIASLFLHFFIDLLSLLGQRWFAVPSKDP